MRKQKETGNEIENETKMQQPLNSSSSCSVDPLLPLLQVIFVSCESRLRVVSPVAEQPSPPPLSSWFLKKKRKPVMTAPSSFSLSRSSLYFSLQLRLN